MATIYGDSHADPGMLRGKTIAVIGYGSQRQAHALNLRDSGHPVVVGPRSGSASWTRAEVDGVEVREVSDAARYADVVVLLVPDQQHRTVYERGIGPHLGRGRTLLVAHGSSVLSGQLRPPTDVDLPLWV
ncbi:MAG: NAD(P)-binding domain-containing protein [Chloroflexota bacterium]|nr:NAD(P)-binding domain-containing protein [Chloroflexota bacterium]